MGRSSVLNGIVRWERCVAYGNSEFGTKFTRVLMTHYSCFADDYASVGTILQCQGIYHQSNF